MRNSFFLGIFLAILCTITYSTSFAAQSLYCLPKKLMPENQNIILNTAAYQHAARLYFIKNISPITLWLSHPQTKHGHAPHLVADEGGIAHAGWDSKIDPGNWSAILLTQKDFAISCASLKKHQVKILDCSELISVCEPNIELSINVRGNYWFVENKPWQSFIKGVKARLSSPLTTSEDKHASLELQHVIPHLIDVTNRRDKKHQ